MQNTRRLLTLIVLILLTNGLFAQKKYITKKNGKIDFYSDAPAEKIEAFNNQVNCALDIGTGDFIFKVLMKSFQFEKSPHAGAFQ